MEAGFKPIYAVSSVIVTNSPDGLFRAPNRTNQELPWFVLFLFGKSPVQLNGLIYPLFCLDFPLRETNIRLFQWSSMERHRYFDLVRWGVAADVLNKYLAKEKERRGGLCFFR